MECPASWLGSLPLFEFFKSGLSTVLVLVKLARFLKRDHDVFCWFLIFISMPILYFILSGYSSSDFNLNPHTLFCYFLLNFNFNTLFFSSVKYRVKYSVLCIYICLIWHFWCARHLFVVINQHILFSLICLVIVCHYVLTVGPYQALLDTSLG